MQSNTVLSYTTGLGLELLLVKGHFVIRMDKVLLMNVDGVVLF